jgi:hypothetical protein
MELNKKQKITQALIALRPKAEWTLIGDDYSKIEWLDIKQTQPTLEELEAEIANPTPQPEPTIAEKLASVGLSIEELKAALGSN